MPKRPTMAATGTRASCPGGAGFRPAAPAGARQAEPTPRTTPRLRASNPASRRPAADGPALATLIGRWARGLERGGRHWTAARKKDSLQRVLDGSRSDAKRPAAALQLVAAWDDDRPGEAHADRARAGRSAGAAPAAADRARRAGATIALAAPPLHWDPRVDACGGTTRAALPPQDEPRSAGEALGNCSSAWSARARTLPPAGDQLEDVCRDAAACCSTATTR